MCYVLSCCVLCGAVWWCWLFFGFRCSARLSLMCFDCSVPLLLVCCVTILYCVALARRFAVFCSNIIQMKHSIINFDVTDFNACVMYVWGQWGLSYQVVSHRLYWIGSQTEYIHIPVCPVLTLLVYYMIDPRTQPTQFIKVPRYRYYDFDFFFYIFT